MSLSPTTRLSLVLRLGDPSDGVAWGRFLDLYAPLLCGFFRKWGLQDADVADLVQEVLAIVARRAETFSHNGNRGAFRAWLYTIARNRLRHFHARHAREETSVAEQIETALAPDDEAEVWEQEYEKRLFAWASQQVQERVTRPTWQAFWQTAVEGRCGEEVGKDLGMTPGAVYVAKSRVMARLKKTLDEMVEMEGH